MRKIGVAALALTLAWALARGVHASSTILGVPGDFQLDNYTVVLPAAGGKATPTKLCSTRVIGAAPPRGCTVSPDGKVVISHQAMGFTVCRGTEAPREYKANVLYKNVFFSPDSKRVIYWTPEGLAQLELDKLPAPSADAPPLKPDVFYKAANKDRKPFGAGWAPSGSEVFVIEHYQEMQGDKLVRGTALARVPLGGGGREILKHPVVANYFMLPMSRFEYGQGPSSAPFKIVLGATDGLYVVETDGSKEKVSDFKPQGLQDIVMGPDPAKPSFLFRMGAEQPGAPGAKPYSGVYVGHLESWQKGKTLELEQVYPANDVHTIWYSARGSYVAWASNASAAYRAPDGKKGSEVAIEIPERGNLPIKGIAWDRNETRLAVCVGNRLYVHDVAKKTTTKALDMGDDAKAFLADPTWRGENEVVFSQYVDMTIPKKQPGKK